MSLGFSLVTGEDDVRAVVQELQNIVHDLRTDMNNTLKNVEGRLQNIGKVKVGDHGTPKDSLVYLLISLVVIR